MAHDRERRCVVARETMAEERLLRVAIAPDGAAVPDVAAKLPGRGAWVEATREAVDMAVRKNLFARSAGRAVTAPGDLADQFERLLAQRCLSLVGLARRSGAAAVGFDQARAAIRKAKPGWVVEARDGSADGRGKVLGMARALWGEDVPAAGCFASQELGAALGREPAAHLVLRHGPEAARFGVEVRRLAGFRPLIPAEWSAENS